MKSRPYTSAEDARLIALYQAGANHSRIAATLGRTTHGVSSRLRVLAAQGAVQLRSSHYQRTPEAQGLADEDHRWLAFWRQPRAVRRQQRIAMAEATRHG